MVRIIDMECNVPRQAPGEVEPGQATPRSAAERPAGYGMANYGRIFRSRREGDASPKMAMDAFVTGSAPRIERAVPFNLERRSPHYCAPIPIASPGAHQLPARHEWCASSNTGCARRAFMPRRVSPGGRLPASDRRYYPLYAKAAELGILVRIYASMNYAADRRMTRAS